MTEQDVFQEGMNEMKESERIRRLADSLAPLLPKKRPDVAALGDSLKKIAEFERQESITKKSFEQDTFS